MENGEWKGGIGIGFRIGFQAAATATCHITNDVARLSCSPSVLVSRCPLVVVVLAVVVLVIVVVIVAVAAVGVVVVVARCHCPLPVDVLCRPFAVQQNVLWFPLPVAKFVPPSGCLF